MGRRKGGIEKTSYRAVALSSTKKAKERSGQSLGLKRLSPGAGGLVLLR